MASVSALAIARSRKSSWRCARAADLYGVHNWDRHDASCFETSRTSQPPSRGSPVVRNKAIVGINAFAHEAGIHQHGMIADARTYEIMRPEDVGFSGTRLVLGKHSGRHAIAQARRSARL